MLNASSDDVSASGCTDTYPAALIRIDGNAPDDVYIDDIESNAALILCSEVMSHSIASTLSGSELPNVEFNTDFFLEASNGA